MICDLCGKETTLVKATIEDTELSVCDNCAVHGKILKKPTPPRTKKNLRKEVQEQIEEVVQNYSSIIKQARAKKGMTQKEFAHFLKEKESIVHKLETGSFTLPLALAKKLEQALNIKLLEIVEEEKEEIEKEQSGPVTIGDLIKMRPKS